MKVALAAASVALLIVGCAAPQLPTPPPSGSAPQPAESPTQSLPAETVAPSPGVTPPPGGSGDADGAADLVDAAAQPLLAGLYLPSGVVARSTDHYALVQSPTDCDTLVEILQAGEWRVIDRTALTLPSPEPGSGVPPLAPVEYLLLESGAEIAYARVGGDESGCVAQVWRLSRQSYSSNGDSFASSGDASEIQGLCVAGAGTATFQGTFIADDGFLLSLSMNLPLALGSHAMDREAELSMGPTNFDVKSLLMSTFGRGASGEDFELPVASFFPANPDTGWEGSVDITRVEPLTGQVRLQNLSDEAGRVQDLDIGFRCDLPPGQLTRAAAAATPPASPPPSTTPGEPNALTLTIASGPHAGTINREGDEVDCSHNLLGNNEYVLTYWATDQVARGDLSGLSVTVAEAGGKADVLITFEGEDAEHDIFSTNVANGAVDPSAQGVQVGVNGQAAGSSFEITFSCGAVDRY